MPPQFFQLLTPPALHSFAATLAPSRPEDPGLSLWCTVPESVRPLGCVIVLPEVFGVNAWIRSVCARLADARFAAVAVPLFARTAPNLELAYDTPSLEVGRSHRDAVTTANVLADLDRTIAWMASTAPFAGLPVGALGFCFGGLLAWWAATHPGVRTVVSAYGARVSEPAPGGGMPTLSALVQAQAHLLCLLGEDDPLIPREEQQQIRQALDEHQSLRLRRELVIYPGAGHGFLCDQRADFRSAAAEHAWCQIIDFLASTLGACSADL